MYFAIVREAPGHIAALVDYGNDTALRGAQHHYQGRSGTEAYHQYRHKNSGYDKALALDTRQIFARDY